MQDVLRGPSVSLAQRFCVFGVFFLARVWSFQDCLNNLFIFWDSMISCFPGRLCENTNSIMLFVRKCFSTKPHACRIACRFANTYVTFLSKNAICSTQPLSTNQPCGKHMPCKFIIIWLSCPYRNYFKVKSKSVFDGPHCNESRMAIEASCHHHVAHR